MLDAWIIDQLQRQEREREERSRPELRIEIEPPMPFEQYQEEQPTEERGVIIIDLLG